MYAQLNIVASFDRAKFIKALRQQIGSNLIKPSVAMIRVEPRSSAEAFARSIVATEILVPDGCAMYFFQGSDTLGVKIHASSVAELKAHVVRIARQLEAIAANPKITSVIAVVYAQENGFDEAIMSGEKQPLLPRFYEAFADKWMSRILTPAIVFLGALEFVPGTPVVAGSLLAVGAATIAFAVESVAVVCLADEWKWRNTK